MVSFAESYNPTVNVYNSDGTYGIDTAHHDNQNPVSRINNTFDKRSKNDFLAGVSVNYEIVKGLKISTRYSQERLMDKYNYTYQGDNTPEAEHTVISSNSTDKSRWIVSSLQYSMMSNNNHLQLTIGHANNYSSRPFEQRDSSYNPLVYSRYINYSKYTGGTVSTFGDADYNFKDKYSFSFSLLMEKSTLYTLDAKPQYFPSFSINWKIGNEKIMKDINWLSKLNFRMAYGVSQRTFQKIHSVDQNTNLDELNGLQYINLHGEKLTEMNIGIDLGILSDWISCKMDYYNRVTKDGMVSLKMESPFPAYTTAIFNYAGIQNKGLELYVNAIPINTSKIKWTVNFNISWNKNKCLTDWDNFDEQEHIRIENGQPIGNIYAYKFAGFSENGTILVYQKDGSIGPLFGGINELSIVGNGSPKNYLGFTNDLKYKRFELTFSLRGALGFKINDYNRSINAHRLPSKNILKEEVSNNTSTLNSDLYLTDYYVEKGDFVKIDNITLGYTITSKLHILHKIKVYIACNNLATLTKFKGMDPEMVDFTGPTPGIYNYDRYPSTRTYVFGINLVL
jgi:hypothetical protein